MAGTLAHTYKDQPILCSTSHKMLGSLAKFFKLFMSSESIPENQDSLLQLVNSHLSFPTNVLLRYLVDLAHLDDDPATITDRFVVTGITHCKDPDTRPEHEFLTVNLMDTRSDSKSYTMFLERTAASKTRPLSYFSRHPDSKSVVDSITQTMKDMKMSSPSTDSSSLPLLHLQESDSESISFFDAASLGSVKAINASSPSIFKYDADDRFTGGKFLEYYGPAMRNIRQIRPLSMTLFDLVVLADVVHEHDPLYSLLSSQCFWYASTIVSVIKRVYSCSEDTSTDLDKTLIPSMDNIRIPPNDYLPKLEGRFMGILITKVEEAVSSVVAANFSIHLQEKHEEVFLFLFRNTTC
jgi:hypothetical protein